MRKPKKKLTARQRAPRKRRRKEYESIFVNGTQTRVKKSQTIDGTTAEEFVRNNADALWYDQNEMWEEIEGDGQDD